MKQENREGLELKITKLKNGIIKTEVTNWPNGLTFYTDQEIRKITTQYTPGIVHYDPNMGNKEQSRVGVAFPPQERSLEKAVHPIIAMSKTLGEFAGFDENNLNHQMGVIEYINYQLKQIGINFEVNADPKFLQEAVEAGYLREKSIAGKNIYFPTEKAVCAMCNKRFEDFMYSLALHTGVNMGTGHRRAPPND